MSAHKPQTESTRARHALQEYLLMGKNRSLAKLAAQMGRPPSYTRTLEIWSSAFNWVEQAQKYDQEQFDKEREQHHQDVQKMNDRHAKIGMEMQRRAIQRLQELADGKKIGAIASIQLLKLAVDVERMARGEAAQRLELGANQEQFDMVIRTVWGRGTDPRRVVDATPGEAEQATSESEVRVKFGEAREEDSDAEA